MNSYFNENGYIQLLKDTLTFGNEIDTRNGKTISRFGTMITFQNIFLNFPLITTKKTFFRGIVEELLWFLKGSTNSKILEEKNINIWKGNSSREYLDNNGFKNYEEGELGPIYGWQWRNFGKKYKNNDKNNFDLGFDQIEFVLLELLKNNSRRAVISAWNPSQLIEMALPPCHISYIFNKNNEGLSCLMTMRSSDLFLGLPFNIGTTALLTQIIATVLHIKPNTISIVACDSHIYTDHVESVKKQINNEIYTFPTIEITSVPPPLDSIIEDKLNWIINLKYEDFKLHNYKCHDTIKANMK